MAKLSREELALARHVMALAQEEPDERWSDTTDDEVKFEFEDLEPTHVDFAEGVTEWDTAASAEITEGEPHFMVEASCEGGRQYQVARARYNPPGKAHPAEYDVEWFDIIAVFDFYPERQGGLGEVHTVIEGFKA